MCNQVVQIAAGDNETGDVSYVSAAVVNGADKRDGPAGHATVTMAGHLDGPVFDIRPDRDLIQKIMCAPMGMTSTKGSCLK